MVNEFVSLLQAVKGIADMTKCGVKLGTVVGGAFKVAGVIGAVKLASDLVNKGYNGPDAPVATTANNLIEFTKFTRLSPIVLIDKKITQLDPKFTSALLQTLLSLYCAYYLQSVNIAANVNNVRVMRLLDQFGTDRDILQATANSIYPSMLGMEDFEDDLDYLPDFGLEAFDYTTGKNRKDKKDFSHRAIPKRGDIKNNRPINDRENSARKARGLGDKQSFSNSATLNAKTGATAPTTPIISNKPYDHDKVIHTIMEESNLAVGKIIDVQIISDGQFVSIPVTATLVTQSIDAADFIAIAKANMADDSFGTRLHQYRSGQIEFIKDFLLCEDLLAADKKALLADKTGLLLSTRSKNTKHTLSTLTSGYASPNQVSAMVIISKQAASDLELVLKGSLKNPHTRNEYFVNNSTMMLIVVDLTMERFTLYQRGIADHRDYTFEDIKGNNKNPNGVNIADVLTAYKNSGLPNL